MFFLYASTTVEYSDVLMYSGFDKQNTIVHWEYWAPSNGTAELIFADGDNHILEINIHYDTVSHPTGNNVRGFNYPFRGSSICMWFNENY